VLGVKTRRGRRGLLRGCREVRVGRWKFVVV
jgi:hypothetical protein